MGDGFNSELLVITRGFFMPREVLFFFETLECTFHVQEFFKSQAFFAIHDLRIYESESTRLLTWLVGILSMVPRVTKDY